MAKAQKIEKPRAEWGSDVIVDMLKAFDVEYVAINPGATFRGKKTFGPLIEGD